MSKEIPEIYYDRATDAHYRVVEANAYHGMAMTLKLGDCLSIPMPVSTAALRNQFACGRLAAVMVASRTDSAVRGSPPRPAISRRRSGA